MSLKIVHCGDFHIGASFSQLNTKLSKIRSDEVRLSLKKTADFCKEKNADALIISGDLFDNPIPTSSDAEFVRALLASLSPIDIYIICGNHDYMCTDSPFSHSDYFSENVHIFPCYEASFEIPEKNAVFWGKSYCKNSVEPSFNDILMDENKINIMLLHGDTVSGSDYNIISKETLLSLPCSYAAFGHIHAGEVFNIGNVKCAYSGTTEGHSFSDTGSTGIIYAEISENETVLTPVDISLRKYRYVEIDITSKSEDDILSEAKALINNTDLFRLNLKGEFPERRALDTAYIKKELEKIAFYIDITDSTVTSYNFEAIENEESLRGAFLRELRQRTLSEEEFVNSAKVGLDALSGRTLDLGGIL